MIRSEIMHFYELVFSKDSTYEVLDALGKKEIVQFVDLNKDSLKIDLHNISQLKGIDELTSKLNQLREWCSASKIDIHRSEEHFNDFHLFDLEIAANKTTRRNDYYRLIEEIVNDRYSLLLKLHDSLDAIKQGLVSSINRFVTLRNVSGLITPIQSTGGSIRVQYMGGVIEKGKMLSLKRILFRTMRSNLIIESFEYNTPDFQSICPDPSRLDINPDDYGVFFFAYPTSSEGSSLSKRVQLICEGMDADIINIPKNFEESLDILNSTRKEIVDSIGIYNNSLHEVERICANLAEISQGYDSSYIEVLSKALEREQEIVKVMSYFTAEDAYYRSCLWSPLQSAIELEDIIRFSHPELSFTILKKDRQKHFTPPTSIVKMPLLDNFQAIVNTYGVPRYREINPAVFSIASFPILFGVMFGDFGHGLIFLIAGIILFKKERFINSLGLKAATELKWLIILMGFFSTYSGLIYNEFMSLKIPFFKSCYVGFKRQGKCVYPFGFDWIWGQSGNEISYFNSYRTKFSVIIGCLQMSLGIFIKGINAIINCSLTDFFLEFIPQIVFFVGLFGYLCFLIIYKWVHEWGSSPPSLLAVMINIYKAPSSETVVLNATYQHSLQLRLLYICLSCVPIMLFGKPLVFAIKKCLGGKPRSYPDNGISMISYDSDRASSDEENLEIFGDTMDMKDKSPSHHEDEDIGEIFVHQMIETIEFVLGSVSNTASYLRLWALSLAHSQLSKVFYDLILGKTFSAPTSFFLDPILGSIKYFFLTVVIIVVILATDSLECFLHALRLHWVEFQNKFYKGDGILFEPFKITASKEE